MKTMTKTSVRRLACLLTEDEVRVRGIDLANANTKYSQLESDKKASARRYKDQMDTVNAQIHDLKDQVRNAVETREVAVEYDYDTYQGKVTITRMDTGEIIERRMMTPKESQGRFEFETPEE